MQLANILAIFKKELIDTLRDRKTLAFMLIIPTVVAPALGLMFSSVSRAVMQKKAVEEVVIVADKATQDRYVKLVHGWFLTTEIASGVRVANSGVVKFLLGNKKSESPTGDMPPEVLDDPAAFQKWTRSMAEKMRTTIADDEDTRQSFNKFRGKDLAVDGSQVQLPQNIARKAIDFYSVAFRGLGMVKFIEPSEVKDDPKVPPAVVPASMKDLPNAAVVAKALRSRQIHGYLVIPAEADRLAGDSNLRAEPVLYYDSTISTSDEANNRVETVMSKAGGTIVSQRLKSKSLTENFIKPIELKEDTDIASRSARTFAIIGGILPYLVLAFAFLGGMYPAIDLGAGEKERGTLETLLLAPCTRTEVALGKFFVILATSLTASAIGVGSMMATFRFMLPASLMEMLEFKIDPGTLIAVAFLAVPISVSFAGLFLATSIYARSFKEAQNYLAPLQFVLILPGMGAMIPGLDMTWKMAMVPILNVSMICRDFLKGDVNWLFYSLTFASCFGFAAACVAGCVYMFTREEVMFRS